MHSAPLEFLVGMFATLGFFSLIAWIVFVFVDGRRRREQLKVTSEFNAKVREKIESTVVLAVLHRRLGGHQI